MLPERFRKKDVESSVIAPVLSPSQTLDRSRVGVSTVPPPLAGEQEIASWRKDRRAKLKELLCLGPAPEARMGVMIWSAEDDVGVVSKRLVQIGHKTVPIYIGYSAKARSERCWMICLQGHGTGMHVSLGVDHKEERWRIPVTGDRDIARWCMANGFNVLCLEQLSLGERREQMLRSRHKHPCQDAAMHRLVLGGTLLGERIEEVCAVVKMIRSIDPNITKTGIIGNSLGGTVAMYSHALCDDVDFIVAAGCVSQFEESLISRSGRHCTDLYIPALLEHFNCSDILMLAAPKVTILVYGIGDQLLPIRGFARAYTDAEAFFRRANAAKNLYPVLGVCGHRHYRNLTLRAFREFPETFGSLIES
jgi:hypothetical protein